MLKLEIDYLTKTLDTEKTNTLLVPEYAGGHLIHDLTQVVGVMAAKKVGDVEVYEFPQYHLDLNTSKKVDPRQAKEIFSRILKGEPLNSLRANLENLVERPIRTQTDLENLASFKIGILTPGTSQGLTDPGIGMSNGTLQLSLKELRKKKKAKDQHTSQEESMARLSSWGKEVENLSIEHLRKVNLSRKYEDGPSTKINLYEIVPWRDTVEFGTFLRLYWELKKLQ